MLANGYFSLANVSHLVDLAYFSLANVSHRVDLAYFSHNKLEFVRKWCNVHDYVMKKIVYNTQ